MGQASRLTASHRSRIRYFYYVVLMTLLSSVAFGEVISQTYYFSNPSIEKVSIHGSVYDRIAMTGISNDGLPGQPALPAVGSRLLLPFNSGVTEIRVVTGRRIVLGAGFVIEPVQYDYVLSADPATIKAALPDRAIYDRDRNFPASRHEFFGKQSFRGYDFAILRLNPVEYNPVTGELAYYAEMTVEVITKEVSPASSLFRGLAVDQEEIQRKVDNVDPLASYRSASKNSADTYDMMILTTSQLAQAFEPLKNYHNSTGVQTEIHTIDEVGSNDPAAVRDFIRQAYLNEGIEYVLIGADDDIIPARDVYASYNGGDGIEEDATIPADLYFGCLDGPYDYNGNGIYGEYGDGTDGGHVDLVAEVYVGRASAGTVEEAQRFVSKTLKYVTTQSTYLRKSLLVGEYLGFGGISDYAGNAVDQLVGYCDDDDYVTIGMPESLFVFDRLYDRDWPTNDWPNSELFDRINDDVHIINHDGHCNSNWAMKSTTSTAIEKMRNTNLFFLYSQGCMPGAFDWGDCWAENVALNTDHGAFAIIMNARYGFGRSNSTDGTSQRYQRQFWDAMYNPEENFRELGRANADSKEDNLYMAAGGTMRWVYYELNLFGDPAIRLWDKWLGLESYALSDIQGDNDGLYEAGETIQLTCSIENIGIAEAQNVILSLTISDAELAVSQGVVTIGDITDGQLGSHAYDPFVFSIPADYVTRVDTFYVDVDWTEDGQAKHAQVSFARPIGAIPILIVDGNAEDDVERYYLEYLNERNLPYQIWTSEFSTGPFASDLMKYDIVVWFEGDFQTTPLTANNIAAIKGYLNGGGSLFLTGQQIAASTNIIDQNFLHDYLKASYVSSGVMPLLFSFPGSQVFAPSDTLSIVGGSGAYNQTYPDRIDTVNGSTGEFKWFGTNLFGGISYSGEYKLVYLTFGYEAILSGDPRWIERDTIFSAILDFFNLEHAEAAPTIVSMAMEPDNSTHLMDHSPLFSWEYFDENGYPQEKYQVQVGADFAWLPDNMWDSGPLTGPSSEITYAGVELRDGENYCVRVRGQNGSLWSNWKYILFHMNSIPVPEGMMPGNNDLAYLGHIRLHHDQGQDIEGDPLTYSYELYADEAMTELVDQIAGLSGSGDKIGWDVSAMLAVGEDYFWRVRANDGLEDGQWSALASFVVGPEYVCGDANGDAMVNVGDAVAIINFVFRGGAAPVPLEAGDANCDGTCNVGDAVTIINYVFRGGAAPCSTCPD